MSELFYVLLHTHFPIALPKKKYPLVIILQTAAAGPVCLLVCLYLLFLVAF